MGQRNKVAERCSVTAFFVTLFGKTLGPYKKRSLLKSGKLIVLEKQFSVHSRQRGFEANDSFGFSFCSFSYVSTHTIVLKIEGTTMSKKRRSKSGSHIYQILDIRQSRV